MRNFRLKKSKKFKKKIIKKSFRKKRKTRKVKKQYKRKRKGTIKYIKKNKRYKKRKTKRNSKKQHGGMVRRRNAAGHSYAIIPENPDAPPPLQMEHLMTVLLGMLGLGGLRTYEKIKDKVK